MDWYLTLDVAQKSSVVLAAATYLLQRRALTLQNERARREKAAAIISEFASSLNPRWSAARKLSRYLNDHQLECADQGREFAIAREHSDLLIAAIPEHITPEQLAKEGDLKLTRQQSFLLRWELLSHLNTAEAVAQAWLTDVAHKETIEDELRFLLEPQPNENILTTCGAVATPENYPALSALLSQLEAQRNRPIVPRKLDRSWFDRILERVFGK